VPGVERYDESALRSKESIDGLRSGAARLEKLTVPFALNESRLVAEHRAVLHKSATVAKHAFADANAARLGACLEVIGHADPPGEVDWNQALSDARAMNVASNLVAKGLDAKDVRARGAGVWDAAPPRGRSATFHLVVREDSSGSGCGASQ
jgi:outer membrane protein OmpA-like peptidoglycan-associated protein